MQSHERQWTAVNVCLEERLLSSISGSALATYGLLHRNWFGTTCAFVGSMLLYRGITGHSFVYQVLDRRAARKDLHQATSVPHGQGIKIEKVVTINRSPEELYQFWRNFANLPRFMDHLKSVTVKDSTHSHWVTKAPAGREIAWDAEIINEKENELIAWRSLPGSMISNAGSVHFAPAPGGRGTELRVVFEYVPPAGRLGTLVAKLFGEEPERQVREDLRHFKEIMESGELPTSEGHSMRRRR
jgi:uncharacterized membrane protein